MARRFIFPMLVLLFAIVCPISCVSQAAGEATASPDHITLTWAGNPATTMTVTWRTDTSMTTGYIEYQKGAILSTTAQSVKATSSNFTTDLQATHLFTANLTALSPNTTYSYRVGDGAHWSSVHKFTTADPNTQSFKFLVFGDSQSAKDGKPNYSLWGNNLHGTYNANPDAKFFINVGDLVDVGQSGAHWNGWFEASAGVVDTIPVMPVMGNHETYGSSDTRRPAYWNAQFRMPQNGPSRLKNQVYSYDYGPVHFVVLDSQQEEEKQYGDILTAQEKWLDADLAASKATWKIVLFHRSAYSIKNDRDNDAIKNAFSPVIDKYHVDLVFNAHDHAVGRTYPIKNGEFKSKPSEGTVYYIVGRSGTKFYPDVHKRDWDAFFQTCEDQPNHLVVNVTNTKLTIKNEKLDGTPIDTFTIDKQKDVLAAPLAQPAGVAK